MMDRYVVYSELSDAKEGDESCGHIIDRALDAQEAVGDACDLFWSINDGWEWMRNGCKLYAVAADGTITKHEVGPPDYDPQFYPCDGDVVP